MADSTAAVIESQVDWLTVSAHGTDASQRMLDYAYHLGKCEQANGNRKHRWRLMGYEGSHVGRVEYGRRDEQSAILRLIGDLARETFDNAISLADAITRLDIAVTWRSDPPDPMLGRNAYATAELFHAKHPLSARPWFTGDSDGGYTCYVGARESAAFFRVYNKEAECRATDDRAGLDRYRACWRFELEAKASMASALAGLLSDAEDRSHVIQNYIHAYADAHGIAAPFMANGRQALLPGFRRRSDAESRIKHLARNVKPTLDWLREAGELDRALTALGLS